MDVRKIVYHHETVFSEAGARSDQAITRVAGIAIVGNPFAGQHVEDLSILFDLGGRLGDELMGAVVSRLARAAVGGGEAVIPSNVKVGPPGATIDVPLGHKDSPWSFDHFDTLTVSVGDSPRPAEIMLVMAVADGGRVNPRCGGGPAT